MKKTFRHREYCRLNQERQRKLEKKKETDIQDAIAKLQCEIGKLSKKGKAAATATTIWAVVLECSSYFNSYVSSDILHATALTFLHGIMTPDVVIGSEFGVEAQLQIWKLFTFYFDDIHLEMTEMDMSTPHTLVAGTILSVTITSNTLVRAFPHLTNVGSGGTKGDKWSPLANRLLGQKLVMRGSALFGWNSAINKVERLDFHADMMTPVTKLLGNVPDVAYVFSKAHVTPDCRFIRDGLINI
ncbi:hypothetical protein PHMEG_00022583 [Phytophthora megakarya]|uniref:Uncharacterized protein n=1 Tax=Phytophthora megakarya TaxID=4795 RepID=A0A225VJ44_9STRA|nr:hypothetical protein PHMEG_00022583 [Phytophthora megakarya]